MHRRRVSLPPGRHFALTWGIPEEYGGMTGALLHRSRAFVRIGGVSVDILTLDDRGDYPELADRLRRSGERTDGMRIRNGWDDLRATPPTPGTTTPEPDEPLDAQEGDDVAELGGVVLRRERRDAGGAFVAADRFRRDGGLLATERLVDGRRRIVVYGPDGVPLRAWQTSWSLYRWWLDRLTGGRRSFLLVDSKTAARFVTGYRRRHVVTVHIVHGSHRVSDRAGALRPSREYALRRADEFDAVALLTTRQRQELIADLARTGTARRARLLVVPNGRDLTAPPSSDHDRSRGVVLASLDARKRLAHTVDAVALARRQDPRVRLDVYGTGPEASLLADRIREQDAADGILLHGFDPAARRNFPRAGFTLLTSTSEGLPLTLVESMAAGCVPIAYDIRYGPADIIDDGVTGFLVADGDVEAMAERILRLQRMPQADAAQMSRLAARRALAFSDDAVTGAWARQLRATADAKRLAELRGAPLRVQVRRVAGAVARRLGHAFRR